MFVFLHVPSILARVFSFIARVISSIVVARPVRVNIKVTAPISIRVDEVAGVVKHAVSYVSLFVKVPQGCWGSVRTEVWGVAGRGTKWLVYWYTQLPAGNRDE